MTTVDEIRSFNRFYTREIGLLNEHLPASELSLPEARVLFELAKAGEQTAADITRILDMDKAHVSRIVSRFRARNLVQSRVSPEHGKRLLLSLTEQGRSTFADLEDGTRRQMEAILKPLDDCARQRLTQAMREIQAIFVPNEKDLRAVSFRKLKPGDLGWITHRQAVLYNREYGLDWTYEGLVATILGDFAARFDPDREDAWVAEVNGAAVGSIFLMRSDDADTAKLRLLYVESSARGLGIGAELVALCADRATALGYKTLTLWTNDILVSARRIYQAAGFTLQEEAAHRSFGQDLVGQTWALDLTGRAS